MAWRLRSTLSLDEFALLMAECNPSEVDTVANAMTGGFDNKEKADAWLRFIQEAVEMGEFKKGECWPYIYDDFGNTCSVEIDNLELNTRINTAATRVSTEAIKRLLMRYGEPLPDFLSHNVPSTTSASTITDIQQERPISDELKAIGALLDGNHQFQSDELATAIQAWLAVTKLCSQGLNSASSIKQEVLDWLEDNTPEISAAQKERIASMVNWDKTGGRPVRG